MLVDERRGRSVYPPLGRHVHHGLGFVGYLIHTCLLISFGYDFNVSISQP